MPSATIATPRLTATEVIQKISTIATLPEVTAQIIATVENPRSDAASLHRIVSHDPALVTRILKVVNSAFYGLPGQIASIDRAIVLLGLNAVKNIAVATSLGQIFRGGRLCQQFGPRDLWTHCIAVAAAARELARAMKIPLADEAFLAGMIHDMGILVWLQTFPEKLRLICDTAGSSPESFCEIERRIFGLDHQRIGAALAEHWKFPRSCQFVAGHHHEPTRLPADGRLLVSLVFTADTLCCEEGRGFNLTALRQRLDQTALHEIGIEQGVVDRVRTQLSSLIETAATIFG